MQTITHGGRGARWSGHSLSAIAALFLLFDSIGKLMQVSPVVAGTAELGYAASTVFPLGVWGGLFLRDAGLRAFLPWRKRGEEP